MCGLHKFLSKKIVATKNGERAGSDMQCVVGNAGKRSATNILG